MISRLLSKMCIWPTRTTNWPFQQTFIRYHPCGDNKQEWHQQTGWKREQWSQQEQISDIFNEFFKFWTWFKTKMTHLSCHIKVFNHSWWIPAPQIRECAHWMNNRNWLGLWLLTMKGVWSWTIAIDSIDTIRDNKPYDDNYSFNHIFCKGCLS